MKTLFTPPRAAVVGAISLTALSLAFSAPAQAIQLANVVDWTSTTSGSLIQLNGNPAGTTVTLTGAVSSIQATAQLDGPRYSNLPLTNPPVSNPPTTLVNATETIRYSPESNLTATFNNPVSNLLLYAVTFQGGTNGATYTFSSPFNVISGFGLTGSPFTGMITANTLTVPTGANGGGILDFGGASLNSLTINSTYSGGNVANNNALTFATAVPLETDALPVVVGAAFMAGGVWWKKKRAGAKALDLSPTEPVKG